MSENLVRALLAARKLLAEVCPGCGDPHCEEVLLVYLAVEAYCELVGAVKALRSVSTATGIDFAIKSVDDLLRRA